MDSHICYSSDADPKHCADCGREMLQLTVSAASSQLIYKPKQNYIVTFSNAEGKVGELEFNGPAMKFTGNAEESAKVFFDWVATHFTQRLAKERQKAKDELRSEE